MKKRARICFYIFVVCALFALGILGYFVLNPQQENVMIGSKKFVTFNEIPNAFSYSISVQSPSDAQDTFYNASYKVTKEETSKKNEIKFNIDVFDDNDINIARESYIQQIISSLNNKIDCVIKDYNVTFFNDVGEVVKRASYENQTLKNVDDDIICCVVSEYFDDDELFNSDGKYHILCKALNEQGVEIENSSSEFDYDYYAYYKDDFLRREKFFMNGAWYDYVISNEDELKEMVWHTILYREDDVNFFVEWTGLNALNINNLVIDAINDYPEYDGLEDASVYAEMNKKIGKLVNFDYYLDFNFTKTYKDLEQKNNVVYDYALEYLHKKDTLFNVDYVTAGTPSERTFAIDDKDEVLVFNTEQLFMVVQYGEKPKFVDENDANYKEEYSIVKTVYDNALSELEKINNSDDLSDYDKALNIYRYLCENVVYDYVTYEFMEHIGDFSILSFGSYNCFYLEGVLLDLENQYAVCDGLSKAYALLCNIEGIPCVKVNGEIARNGGNHAWNKVCLEIESKNLNVNESKIEDLSEFKSANEIKNASLIDSTNVVESENENKNWYYVDITWGVATYEEKKSGRGQNLETENFEILTHSYFLVGNDSNKIINFESEIDTSSDNEAIDYYEEAKYFYTDLLLNEHSGDFKIESDEELSDVFEYAKHKLIAMKIVDPENASVVIEIEFSKDYLRNGESQGSIYMNMEIIRDPKITYESWLKKLGIDQTIGCEHLKVTNNIAIFRIY